jgi:hypothetical protein
MRFRCVLLIVLLLSIAASAQELPNAPSWDAVRYATKKKVEVRMNNGAKYSGKVRGVTDISMSLLNEPKTLEKDDIDRVSRTFKSRKTGALWGVLIGGGSGAIIGYAGTSPCNPGDFCVVSRGGGTVLGAAFGGALGAAVGAFIGKTKRILLFQRPLPGPGKPSPYIKKFFEWNYQ